MVHVLEEYQTCIYVCVCETFVWMPAYLYAYEEITHEYCHVKRRRWREREIIIHYLPLIFHQPDQLASWFQQITLASSVMRLRPIIALNPLLSSRPGSGGELSARAQLQPGAFHHPCLPSQSSAATLPAFPVAAFEHIRRLESTAADKCLESSSKEDK